MTHRPYRAEPDPNEKGWPRGVPYIIGNEACERFSFYGLRSLLQVHLTSLFLQQATLNALSTGEPTASAESQAQAMVHVYFAAAYATPMIGAVLSDRWLGKFRTIMSLSLVYCLGHLVLSLAEQSIRGMAVGLGLIAIGAGGIKPCVSAHVGDQFGRSNWHRVGTIFQMFYFIINFGSFTSTLLIPFIYNWERKHWAGQFDIGGYQFQMSLAFGLPGLLMLMATIVFWMGRRHFVHVPPNPGGRLGLMDAVSSSLLFIGALGLPLFFADTMSPQWFWFSVVSALALGIVVFGFRQSAQQDDGFLAVLIHSVFAGIRGDNRRARTAASHLPADSMGRHWLFADAARKFGELTAEGPLAVLRIVSVLLLVSVFWALFDQHSSTWIRQAEQMDRTLRWGDSSYTMLAAQTASLNPLFVMILIPMTGLGLGWLERRGLRVSPLQKMTVGMFLTSLAFVMVAVIQGWIDQASGTGGKVSVLWQLVPYLIITESEVLVSVTGLEFAYTQAPRRMKSTIMGLWFLVVSLGNALVVIVTRLTSGGVERSAHEGSVGQSLSLHSFFWLFALLMAGAALLFGIRASWYRYREYTQ